MEGHSFVRTKCGKRGNESSHQKEMYQCEDCTGCPYATQCKKMGKNRTIRQNEELTSFHKTILDNLESIHGALLRMERSIEAEGGLGIVKHNRYYKRIVRKGLKWVKPELLLVALGIIVYDP